MASDGNGCTSASKRRARVAAGIVNERASFDGRDVCARRNLSDIQGDRPHSVAQSEFGGRGLPLYLYLYSYLYSAKGYEKDKGLPPPFSATCGADQLTGRRFIYDGHHVTYSIVARDPQTRELGVAVQSHYFQVGPTVPWAISGVGAVATQSRVDVRYGPLGLELMRAGYGVDQALAALLASDPEPEVRQVAMVDAEGRVAVHTGRRCIAEAGHRTGSGYSVQANLMLRDTVWDTMVGAFEGTGGPLAERMLAALDAAEAEGGDIRGKQSAAMLVVAGTPTGRSWEDRLIDLRVEDHGEPLMELRRLLRLKRAYQSLREADLAVQRGDSKTAALLRANALQVGPDLPELRFWVALGMAAAGDMERSVPLLREVIKSDSRWWETMRRLPASGRLSGELLDELQRRLRTA